MTVLEERGGFFAELRERARGFIFDKKWRIIRKRRRVI